MSRLKNPLCFTPLSTKETWQIRGVRDENCGRYLQVATKNMPLQLTEESVVSVNTLGLPSMMGHTILKPNPRELKSPQDPSQDLPRLIPVSGRTAEGVEQIMKKVGAASTHACELTKDIVCIAKISRRLRRKWSLLRTKKFFSIANSVLYITIGGHTLANILCSL